MQIRKQAIDIKDQEEKVKNAAQLWDKDGQAINHIRGQRQEQHDIKTCRLSTYTTRLTPLQTAVFGNELVAEWDEDKMT